MSRPSVFETNTFQRALQPIAENPATLSPEVATTSKARRELCAIELPKQLGQRSAVNTPILKRLPPLNVFLEKNKNFKSQCNTPKTQRLRRGMSYPLPRPVVRQSPRVVTPNGTAQNNKRRLDFVQAVQALAMVRGTPTHGNATSSSNVNAVFSQDGIIYTRNRSQTAPEEYEVKRRRGNYKCGKCGGPKKNHNCPLKDSPKQE